MNGLPNEARELGVVKGILRCEDMTLPQILQHSDLGQGFDE